MSIDKYFRFAASQGRIEITHIATRRVEDIMILRKRLVTFPTMKKKSIG